MIAWWSWILTAVGVTGLYFAGRRRALGWAIGLGAQVLWIAYALTTRQYGFLVSAGAYGWVYARNFRSWTKPSPQPEEEVPDAAPE
ncbi:hypothetical protein PV728_47455 [Streptomyces europaeiscabiei]|uniref:hypothetical protein n=1 Tax=Streptomyces europaeiscabiei TaxID=146819 RepID=UPI0029A072BF|nr:hypothetical protein [Streptomyces europaeiscabiei]MDX3637687.1 hypothetical protein [Streptomyces europaeiscabiei]MDX3655518.1 hypothetical protein [Streptomyces europaeiscabiei]